MTQAFLSSVLAVRRTSRGESVTASFFLAMTSELRMGRLWPQKGWLQESFPKRPPLKLFSPFCCFYILVLLEIEARVRACSESVVPLSHSSDQTILFHDGRDGPRD